MSSHADIVSRPVLYLLVLQLQIQVFTSLSITVNKWNDIPDATRTVELKAITINCFLNDIVRLAAPVISEQARYYLLKPNGDTIKLNLSLSKKFEEEYNSLENLISAKFYPNTNAIIEQTGKFDIFNVSKFTEQLQHLELNEFFLGPLLEEDYGNWMLSIYTKDSDGEWIEIFQTVTLAITEFVDLKPHKHILNLGETLHLSFAYPFQAIETCEIVAPRSTFDRFYTRNITNFNKCAFTIPNLTEEDNGVWKIIGVGRLIHIGATNLNLIDDSYYIWG